MVDKLLKFISNVLYFILCAVLVVVLYNFVELKILHKPYSSFLGYTVFEVASGSMEPTISQYDIVVVRLGSEIDKNDIITFEQDNAYVTHRVIDIQGDYLITKGDANNSKDTPIFRKKSLGKVVKVLKNLGKWKRVLGTPKVLIGITLSLFLFTFAFSTKKKISEDFAIYRKGIIKEL